MTNNLTSGFFRNNKPRDVVQLVNKATMDFCCTNPVVPIQDRQFFNMLNDLKDLAEDAIKQEGGSHGQS